MMNKVNPTRLEVILALRDFCQLLTDNSVNFSDPIVIVQVQVEEDENGKRYMDVQIANQKEYVLRNMSKIARLLVRCSKKSKMN
jgi:hypothetical protein